MGPITDYDPKTKKVKDRRIVSTFNRKSNALDQMAMLAMTLSNP